MPTVACSLSTSMAPTSRTATGPNVVPKRARAQVDWARQKTHITLRIVRRNPSTKGFKVLPRRWVADRTFAWIIKNRRFVRDYEQLTTVAEALIIIDPTATLIRPWS